MFDYSVCDLPYGPGSGSLRAYALCGPRPAGPRRGAARRRWPPQWYTSSVVLLPLLLRLLLLLIIFSLLRLVFAVAVIITINS